MSAITVVISKASNVRRTIKERYQELYQEWKIENPGSKNYTRIQLNTNIKNALSVNGKSFDEHQFRQAAIDKWRGEKVLPYAHWYFLVRFQNDKSGNIYGIIEDACYEGDYHNDNMNTRPYNEALKRLENIRAPVTPFRDTCLPRL